MVEGIVVCHLLSHFFGSMLNMERHHIAIVFNGCSVQSCSILALDVLLVDAGYRRLGVEISVRPATAGQRQDADIRDVR
jgi:hypothetical protein